MRVPLRTTATAKAAIRRVVWKAGYDLVPLASSFVQVLRAQLATTDLLIDVGANTGQFAERMRAFGYAGRIVSFEPSSGAFDVLSQRAAEDEGWEPRQLALGANAGPAELHLSANSKSSSLLTIEDRHTRAAPKSAVIGREAVTVATLDDQFARSGFRRAMLKLDVQGYEFEVLKGAQAVLDRIDSVQCELSVVPLYEGQADFVELISWLRDAGLSLMQLEPEFQDPQTGAILQLEALFARDRASD